MDIRITREPLRKAGACYDDAKIDRLTPKTGITLDEGLALDVPVNDKYWALCYAAGLPDRILREHACWCARQALNAERAAGREPDPRSWAAVEVAERFARGEATTVELADAGAAARAAASAADSAAWNAARAAAMAAARAAWNDARAAAYSAARDAAWDAACAADSAAASDAAWDAQLADLVKRIRNA
jgi:hypothetical protein